MGWLAKTGDYMLETLEAQQEVEESAAPGNAEGLETNLGLLERASVGGQTVKRWVADGMPLHREGQFVSTSSNELNAWLGQESGKPVHGATENTDLTAELRRGLSFVRREKPDRPKKKHLCRRMNRVHIDARVSTRSETVGDVDHAAHLTRRPAERRKLAALGRPWAGERYSERSNRVCAPWMGTELSAICWRNRSLKFVLASWIRGLRNALGDLGVNYLRS